MRHFPKVFQSWMFYLQQSDESQFLQVLNDLGRVDDVVHLLIENAWNETDITHRKEALKKVLSVVNGAISAGRKEMAFYQHVGEQSTCNA